MEKEGRSEVADGCMLAVLVVVVVFVAVLAAGCELPVRAELAIGSEEIQNEKKIETQSESLPNGDCENGRVVPHILCPCPTGRYDSTQHVCTRSRVATKHPCDAPGPGTNSSLFCP